MKRSGLLIVLVLIGSIALASQANASIAGSSITAVNPAPLPFGTPTDITFTFNLVSNDLNYLDRLVIELPAQWTINSVANTPANACGQTSTQGFVGQSVFWQSGIPNTGCGAWEPATYQFTANVTVNSCWNSPWVLPWIAVGDVWGAEPRSVSGTVAVTAVGCAALHPVPGCDFSTGRTATTMNGLFIQDAIVYAVPGQPAFPQVVIEAGKVYDVDELDATGTYRRVLISCSWAWVEADKVIPVPVAP